jgi:hypothetical protein
MSCSLTTMGDAVACERLVYNPSVHWLHVELHPDVFFSQLAPCYYCSHERKGFEIRILLLEYLKTADSVY